MEHKEYILKLDDVSTSSESLRGKIKLKKINLKIKKGERVSIISSPEERKILARMLIGELKRTSGDMYFDNSLIAPWGIARNRIIKRRLGRRVKYIDDSFTSILKPTTLVSKAFKYSLNNPELNRQRRNWDKAMLYKKIFLIIGESFKWSEKKLALIIDSSLLKEKIYYETRNSKHHNELRRTYSILKFWRIFRPIENFLTERGELMSWARKNKDVVDTRKVVDVFNKRLSLELSHERDEVSKKYSEYKDLSKGSKNERRESLTTSYVLRLAFLDSKRRIGNALKKQNNNQFKKNYQKYEYIHLTKINDDSSMYESAKTNLKNLGIKTMQLRDLLTHKRTWFLFRKFFTDDERVNELIINEIGKYLEHTLKSRTQIKQESAYIANLEKVGLNKNYLNARTGYLNVGERIQVALALAFSTNPDLLILEDSTRHLDTTLRGQLIEIIKRVQNNNKFALIFLTDDLDVGASFSNYTYVLDKYIVEGAQSSILLTRPLHPVTRNMLLQIQSYDVVREDTPPEIDYEMVPYKIQNIELKNRHFVLGSEVDVRKWQRSVDSFEMKLSMKYLIQGEQTIKVG